MGLHSREEIPIEGAKMPNYDEFYKARDLITAILEKDLIGPVKEDEVLDELPLQYYAAGMLFPAADGERGSGEETSGEVNAPDNEDMEDINEVAESISAENMGKASSAGITFAVSKACKSVSITAAYAFYQPEKAENGQQSTVWRRNSHIETHEISVRESAGKCVKTRVSLEGGIWLHLVIRPRTEDGNRILTAALVNENKATDNIASDSSLSAFQVSLRVSAPDEKPCFVPVRRTIPVGMDEEIVQMDMLYSHARTWAQGHGCSAGWDTTHDEPTWISTTFFPQCHTLQMKSPSAGLDEILDMKTLAEGDRTILIPGLKKMADAYDAWIDSLENGNVANAHHENAKKSIMKCRKACARIRKGIECLEKDEIALKAFMLANEAMLMQQERPEIRMEGKPRKPAWRLFQLAFFLHELSSFVLPESPERREVDLLWFPTGGGKTEAYLGIAAFAIFLRRLKDPEDDGVTVIMRYTLRLLTLQQFERASRLILACDILRERELPETPEIAIGFWAGNKMTPNKLADAQKALEAIKHGRSTEESPCLLKKCPWCGSFLSPEDYSVNGKTTRMVVRCNRGDCPFSKRAMPIHFIDDCLYCHLPAFVVATVDKFAQVPLQERAGRILGAGTGKNPPDLIIQDELHLVSGPLGTMTGLYEAAFQRICEKNGIPPKVIASTATIRNAAAQILSLYGREHTQFPPSGTSMRDSFFAVEASADELPSRLYCGVMGGSFTTTTMLIRVNAALLFATRYLSTAGYGDEVIDNFWTLTDYFNSLRELGGSYVRILDDVRGRFAYLANKKFASLCPGVDPNAKFETILELTSRKESIDLPAEIARLERKWERDNHADVYDFVLASNMISVGVDVGRLGLMIILGQPKTSAEYIQASSRIGRRNPGLVIAIFNARRSRDRSHFEQFTHYHSALYRHVEASSLTPFSDRARDRGLQALFVSLCRGLVPGLASDEDAGKFNPSSDEVMGIMEFIRNYVSVVDPAEKDSVRAELEEMANEWKLRSSECPSGFFYRERKDARDWLIRGDMATDRFRMMNSLRSVEAQSSVYILGEKQ